MELINKYEPDHLAYWADHTYVITVFTSPEEVAHNIQPAVGIITLPREAADLGVVRVALKPTPGELKALAMGGTVWLSTWGGLPPFMVEVQPPPLEHTSDDPSHDCILMRCKPKQSNP